MSEQTRRRKAGDAQSRGGNPINPKKAFKQICYTPTWNCHLMLHFETEDDTQTLSLQMCEQALQ